MGKKDERPVQFTNIDYRIGRHLQSFVSRQTHPNDISLVSFRGFMLFRSRENSKY